MDIDICLCTYRRPHVADTLRSLAKLKLKPDWQLRVIVADNDETPSAKQLVETTAQENRLSLLYLHAPARNISIARNACLDAATAAWLAFIDDDEIAAPQWLMSLMSTENNIGSDVVLGPMKAIYPPEAPAWMKAGDFHSISPVWVKGVIITGYTCNALVKHVSIGNHRFRDDLGRSGGEDTIFFAELHQEGKTIGYAPDATVTEVVAKDRLSLNWLIKRYFRSGQTHGLVLWESDERPQSRFKNAFSSILKASFCFMMVVLNVIRPSRAGYWFLRGVMHCGVVARLLGKKEIIQYG